MTRFDAARNVNIAYILESYGYKPDRNGKYLCPVHNERTPSATIWDNKLKCFGCGGNLSTVDLIQRLENVTAIQAVNLILSRFGNEKRFESIIKPLKGKQEETKRNFNIEYIRKVSSKIYRVSDNKYIERYLVKRCIDDVAKELMRFGVVIRHNFYKSTNYIIYDFGDYMIQKALNGKLKRNIGSPNIFVMEYNENLSYGIVEGIEDGLSLLKAFNKQINIICLNSIANKKKFFKMIEEEKRYKSKKFIFALDYDKAGKITGKEIREYFIKNDIKFDYYMNFYKAASSINCIKDINDYIIYLNKTTKEGKYDPKN